MRRIIKASEEISPEEFIDNLDVSGLEEEVSRILGFKVRIAVKKMEDGRAQLQSINLIRRLPSVQCAFKSIVLRSHPAKVRCQEGRPRSIRFSIYLWCESDGGVREEHLFMKASTKEGQDHWNITPIN